MCLGHLTIWAAIWNRLHGVGLSFGVCSRMTAVLVALGATIPTALVTLILRHDFPLFQVPSMSQHSVMNVGWSALVICADAYVMACWLALPYSVVWRIWRRWKSHPPVHHFTKKELAFGARKPILSRRSAGNADSLESQRFFTNQLLTNLLPSSKASKQALLSGFGWGNRLTQPSRESHSVGRSARLPLVRNRRSSGCNTGQPGREPCHGTLTACLRDGREHHFLLHLPGNESLMCEQVDIGIRLARLPKHIEGMTIVHLSDLHFTGKIGLDYYRQAIEHTNSLQPDLIFVTGDIVDRSDCVEDAAHILSGLRARHGVFFVLGNHDLRADASVVRAALSEAGLIDVGGRVVRLSLDGITLLIGGNELPWLGPAPDFAAAANGDGWAALRFLLAHTPDQFSWAVRQRVDLMLAGHTHGGQICCPWLGPIIAPSARGVRYAHGLHYREPTAMYVTRGLAGEFPVRYFCPPELTRVVLFSGDTTIAGV